MAERTKSSELPVSLQIYLLGTVVGGIGAGIIAGPGGMLLFIGLAFMAVGVGLALAEDK